MGEIEIVDTDLAEIKGYFAECMLEEEVIAKATRKVDGLWERVAQAARDNQVRCPPELKFRTPAHTKHLGWYLEFELGVTNTEQGPPPKMGGFAHSPTATAVAVCLGC